MTFIFSMFLKMQICPKRWAMYAWVLEALTCTTDIVSIKDSMSVAHRFSIMVLHHTTLPSPSATATPLHQVGVGGWQRAQSWHTFTYRELPSDKEILCWPVAASFSLLSGVKVLDWVIESEPTMLYLNCTPNYP